MSNIDNFNEQYENEPIESNETSCSDGKWALKDRLRSKVLWISVVAKLITIFTIIGFLKKYNIEPTIVEEVAYAFISILELFGILNDPTNRNGF